MKHWHWLGFCLVVMLLWMASTWRPAVLAQEQPRHAEQRMNGELLVIYTDAEDRGAVLEKTRIETIGGRQFLTGTSVEVLEKDWKNGMVVWLPMDALTYVIEFDSLDEYRKRIADHAVPQAEDATRPRLRGGGL
jgi:hypothetical protein